MMKFLLCNMHTSPTVSINRHPNKKTLDPLSEPHHEETLPSADHGEKEEERKRKKPPHPAAVLSVWREIPHTYR